MIFSILILAVSLSLDAFGVGLAYGIRKIRVPTLQKMIICFFSITYAAVALIIGKWMFEILSQEVAKYIGVGILTFMGGWIIIHSLFKKDGKEIGNEDTELYEKTLIKIVIKSLGITVSVIKNPESGDIDKSGVIDIPESLLLGLALSVDAIGVGIGSALTGFHSMIIPFAVGVFQLMFLYAGLYIGRLFGETNKISQKVLSTAPGLFLICLALIRLK